MWKPASEPPEAKPGLWSSEVIVITNYGDVFCISYFGDRETGTWQRPARFNKGEKPEWWIDKPNLNQKEKVMEKAIPVVTVYCRDCEFICKPAGALYEPHPESICLSPDAIRPNFVTGHVEASQCKSINTDGECKLFKQKNNDRFTTAKQ